METVLIALAVCLGFIVWSFFLEYACLWYIGMCIWMGDTLEARRKHRLRNDDSV